MHYFLVTHSKDNSLSFVSYIVIRSLKPEVTLQWGTLLGGISKGQFQMYARVAQREIRHQARRKRIHLLILTLRDYFFGISLILPLCSKAQLVSHMLNKWFSWGTSLYCNIAQVICNSAIRYIDSTWLFLQHLFFKKNPVLIAYYIIFELFYLHFVKKLLFISHCSNLQLT